MKLLLWEARTSQKITLMELAEKTGISKSTLDNYENEIFSPKLNHLEKIAKALNLRITDLFESDYK